MGKCNKSLIICIFSLASGCARDKPSQESGINLYKSYDLEALTVQIPSTWESLNTAAQGLESSNGYKSYLFLNKQSKDIVLRETVLIEIAQREGTYSFSKLEKALLVNLSEGQDQIRVVGSKNLIVQGGELKIVELSCRNIETNKELMEIFAFYSRGKQLAILLWAGVSHPGSINQNNRELFMQVVNSVQWKKP